MKISLIAKGSQGKVEFEVGETPVTVGRGEGATVRIDDPNCSRQHIKLYVKGNKLVLEDLGSKNGTYVNAAKVTRIQLALLDKISIGSTEIRIHADKNASGINELLRKQEALGGPERPRLEVEHNPTLADVRHNPLTAIHKAPRDLMAQKKKLRNSKLFEDAYVAGDENETLTAAEKEAIRRAKLVDKVTAVLVALLAGGLTALVSGSALAALVVGAIGAAGVRAFNRRYPRKTIGRRLMAIDYDD